MENKVSLKDKLKEYQKQQKALLATNFYNFETLKGILTAASSIGSPIILQLTKSSIEYMGLKVATKLAKAMLEEYEVEGWIHLDHGGSYDLIASCLDAGFNSVMIDASELSFRENVKITKKVVNLAKLYDVNVEAELGYIAKLGQSSAKQGFTLPSDAKMFVEETGVNSLAVAIGSAHGFYKGEPKLELDLLLEIKNATPAFLVLHGGSGIPNNMLREAIKRGITKINLATEIKNIFMKSLKDRLRDENEIDLRLVFPVATDSVTSLIVDKLKALELEN